MTKGPPPPPAPTAYTGPPACRRAESPHLVHPAQEGELDVPIHAYPTMGGSPFPARLDFGRLPLGSSATRRIRLTNQVGSEPTRRGCMRCAGHGGASKARRAGLLGGKSVHLFGAGGACEAASAGRDRLPPAD